jgi:peptidoglycan-N-acetylglucosamine deacetylase
MQTRRSRLISFFRAICAALPALACCGAKAAACGPDALGVSRIVEIGGAPTAIGLKTYPRALALADREVVLTFDDGPALPTPQVLEALAAECVKATFFVIGAHAEEQAALLRREAAEGHTIGHHSFNHPARTLRMMSEAAAKADIDRGIAAVERALGLPRESRAHTPFFRFPGFADTPELLDWLQNERGMTIFGADLWASDWRWMTPQTELALTLSRLEAAGKGVILFHDSKAATAAMLPDFLRALKTRGYRIVHIVPGGGPTPVEDAPAGWTSTTEPVVQRVLGRDGKSEN